MLLQSAGHEVRVAYDGAQAVEVLGDFAPEMAFLDIQLPDTSGYAVAKQLRKQHGRRVNIVGITGGAAKQLPFAGNFDQYAIKPITAARLYQLIEVAREAIKAS